MEGNAARINAVASYEAVMKPVDEKKAWMLACLNDRSMTVQEYRLMAGECRKQELTHLKELTRVCQELHVCREFPSNSDSGIFPFSIIALWEWESRNNLLQNFRLKPSVSKIGLRTLECFLDSSMLATLA